MKKNDRSAEMGALIGGLLFFPPIIPLVFTMGFILSTNNLLFGLFPGLFPIIGSIIGAHIGGYIGKNKTSLAPFKRRSCSISFWCSILFTVLGLEIGFLFSPVTLIGLGNTSTAIDLWFFSIMFGIAGAVLGVTVGLLAFIVSYGQSKT